MARALRLAERGLYTTTPNPRVGCVLAKNGRIVGEGWHERAGGPHAEVSGVECRGYKRSGCHRVCLSRTLQPPRPDAAVRGCIDRREGGARGRWRCRIRIPRLPEADCANLREAGIKVDAGILETEARELNIGFVSRMTRGQPWMRVKIAASLDGKTALNNKVSQWITGADARRDGHRWRARSCAVMTGIGTLADDDPRLTVRDVETLRQPLRVVVDSRLRITPEARILEGGGVLVATATRDDDKNGRLAKKGAEVVVLPNAEHKVDLLELAKYLAGRGINEVLVEAGINLNSALLRAGVVDELLIYLAPHMLGDAARGMFDLGKLTEMNKRLQLNIQETRMIGPDLRILARPVIVEPGA